MLKIGIIGLDSSHAVEFTELLNNDHNPYHVKGGKVVIAYPGGSKDFELSISRVGEYTKILKEKYGVQIVDSPEEVAENSDGILIESVDGRVHFEQFSKIVSYKKPVFIDKPISLSSEETSKMFEIAEKYGIPLMSSSALRYAEGLCKTLSSINKEDIIGVDVYGPMPLQPTQPGFFWYGIHMVEILFTILGRNFKFVKAINNDDHDLVIGVWEDGRIGTVRGNRKGNNNFGALIHLQKYTKFVDINAFPKPYYASILEKIMEMFVKGMAPIEPDETKQIIRFIEIANQCRK
ncbi:Gfo/Idh/MocA family protein [Caldanaerobacter subterraneus]|uniref:Gfo/Idh/MocA family protein n=1 Tax=Caldanaerobacter subterraneus TaxID=911092 RepID=UPI003464D671